MSNFFDSTPEEERTFSNPAYGTADPGMVEDMVQWRDKLFSSPWGSQYQGLEYGGRFEQLRADWRQNRKAYTPEESAASAYAVLMAVQDRNERIFDTPTFKRGKLTYIDFYDEDDDIDFDPDKLDTQFLFYFFHPSSNQITSNAQKKDSCDGQSCFFKLNVYTQRSNCSSSKSCKTASVHSNHK
jgi:hypothetical protein